MSRKSLDLLVATRSAWIEVVLDDFDTFLQDHANCERKASALAMSFVVKYADRTRVVGGLIDLAREELEHFQLVYGLLVDRGLPLTRDEPDAYVNSLLSAARHGREERFIDRMLIASVIECRGAERFGLLATRLPDDKLREIYTRLWRSEIKHGHQFVHLLLRECDENKVNARLRELLEIEAGIVDELEFRAALH